ncbi:MAG TPA: hypothetical protein VJB34_04760 [Bdellovibrionota bacterium]|nr:hypothetical protein [Bdellovibrionota bacterium]
MKEFVKIVMLVTLVTGLILLMGCGKLGLGGGSKEQPVYGPNSYEQYFTDPSSYTGVSSDDEWVISVKTTPDVVNVKNMNLPVDVHLELIDRVCGVTYAFDKLRVFPQYGAVMRTHFRSGAVVLGTSVWFNKYFPESKVVEGQMNLELPERMNCRVKQNYDRWRSGSGSDNGAFNDPFFQNNTPNYGNTEYPSFIQIQLQ